MPRRRDQHGQRESRPRAGQRPPHRDERAKGGDRDVQPWREVRPRPSDDLVRIAGLPSVAELFEASPARVERLYFESALKADVEPFCAVLARRRKVFRQVGDDEMRRVAGTAMHGGVVALAKPRPVNDLDLAAARAWAAAGHSLLFLDGVGNPQNIGAIARTAAFFGVRRIVLSDHRAQAGPSDASYRIAKGGLEHIDLYRVARLPEVLRSLSDSYQVVGTAVSGTRLVDLKLGDKPVALVLGNEEDGMRSGVLSACTSVVSLSGTGRVQSLNVSAAAAILIQALLASR